jgi:hypothetical protein
MLKYIRVLEVPLLLLTIGMGAMEQGSMGLAIFLIIISTVRLIANVITDDFLYKK